MTGWLFIQATTKRTKIDLTIVPWSLAHDVIHLTANCIVNLSATSTPLNTRFLVRTLISGPNLFNIFLKNSILCL